MKLPAVRRDKKKCELTLELKKCDFGIQYLVSCGALSRIEMKVEVVVVVLKVSESRPIQNSRRTAANCLLSLHHCDIDIYPEMAPFNFHRHGFRRHSWKIYYHFR